MPEARGILLRLKVSAKAVRCLWFTATHQHAACPMLFSMVCRGVPTLAAFDLDDFMDSAARTRKWQCPHTLRHSCVQDLHSDAFVQRILDSLQVWPTLLCIPAQ